MSKAEEILSAEFWCNENYNMKESGVISFEMMNAYANYITESRVNAISDEAIKKLAKEYSTNISTQWEFVSVVKWFKNKLLKK